MSGRCKAAKRSAGQDASQPATSWSTDTLSPAWRKRTWDEFARNVARIENRFDAPIARTRERTPGDEPLDVEEWVCKYHGKGLPSKKVPGEFYCPGKMAYGSFCREKSSAK